MSCSSNGPITIFVFLLLALMITAGFAFLPLIDGALLKRHPDEHRDVRGHVFTGYMFYAWEKRGRELGDPQLTTLLDRFRLLQIGWHAGFALFALAMYVGL